MTYNFQNFIRLNFSQSQVFNAHAETLEMGILGRVGGPKLKLGRPQPPAHINMVRYKL